MSDVPGRSGVVLEVQFIYGMLFAVALRVLGFDEPRIVAVAILIGVARLVDLLLELRRQRRNR